MVLRWQLPVFWGKDCVCGEQQMHLEAQMLAVKKAGVGDLDAELAAGCMGSKKKVSSAVMRQE